MKISNKYLLINTFKRALEREELYNKKYSEYYKEVDNKVPKQMIKNYKKISKDHIKMLKDLMITLNLNE